MSKPFAIEIRAIRPIGEILKDWTAYRRYATERDRDKALEVLNSKLDYGCKVFEYRKAEK